MKRINDISNHPWVIYYEKLLISPKLSNITTNNLQGCYRNSVRKEEKFEELNTNTETASDLGFSFNENNDIFERVLQKIQKKSLSNYNFLNLENKALVKLLNTENIKKNLLVVESLNSFPNINETNSHDIKNYKNRTNFPKIIKAEKMQIENTNNYFIDFASRNLPNISNEHNTSEITKHNETFKILDKAEKNKNIIMNMQDKKDSSIFQFLISFDSFKCGR